MSKIFGGKKSTQAKPPEPTEEEKKKLAEKKTKEEENRLKEEETRLKLEKEEKAKKEADKKAKEKAKKEREELEEKQKETERNVLKSELLKSLNAELDVFRDEIQTMVSSVKKEQIIPLGLDVQMKSLSLEQDKLKAQLEVLDKIKELAKPQSSGFLLYERKIIQIYLRKKFPEMNKYTDMELNTEEKIKALPFYTKLQYQDQQLVLFMATCIRRAGMIEMHNLILSDMNAVQFKP